MNNSDLCELINKSVLQAHNQYLKAAGYAATGMPESYVQSEIFRSLANLFGRTYRVVMEPRIYQIQNNGTKGQRVDIAVLKSGETAFLIKKSNSDDEDVEVKVAKNKIALLIEVKRSARAGTIGSDIERIRSLKGNCRFTGIVVSYCSATKKDKIKTLVAKAKKEHGKLKSNCSGFIKSKNRRDADVWFQSVCFIVLTKNKTINRIN
jgi:hypothetical protein